MFANQHKAYKRKKFSISMLNSPNLETILVRRRVTPFRRRKKGIPPETETSEITNRNLSALARGKMMISEGAQEHALRTEVLDITIAFHRLQEKNRDVKDTRTKKRNKKPEEKEIKEKKREDIENKYSSLTQEYQIRFQLSFYRKGTDYEKLYAHMGNARLPKSQFISFYTTEEKSHASPEEYTGTMTGLEAESTVRRIIYMQLFGTTDGISIEERERFAHWRHFNHEMRRFYESTASVRYKPMNMALKMPVLAR